MAKVKLKVTFPCATFIFPEKVSHTRVGVTLPVNNSVKRSFKWIINMKCHCCMLENKGLIHSINHLQREKEKKNPPLQL